MQVNGGELEEPARTKTSIAVGHTNGRLLSKLATLRKKVHDQTSGLQE